MFLPERISRIMANIGFGSRNRYRSPVISDYDRPIVSADQGNSLISDALRSGVGFAASRFGSVELRVLGYFLENIGKHKQFPKKFLDALCINAGFFPYPPKREDVEKFCFEYLQAIELINFLGVWMQPYESFVINQRMKSTTLIPLRSLEPYYFDDPYSKELENKRVLVIHPYKDSILSQYSTKRTKLFGNEFVLPYFDLDVMRPVQSIAFSPVPFDSWFHALQAMKDEITTRKFDVAIIGAGAYGLPLAAHIKRLGKQAIHLGGATQILFGIKGKRWSDLPQISKHFNDSWVSPLESERPVNANFVERGCYW